MSKGTPLTSADVRMELLPRFFAKLEVTRGGCWLWAGAISPNGYGSFWVGDHRKAASAHKFAYVALVGDVPDGMVLDHLCRIRCCVNPDHLEPVTDRENWWRSEHQTIIAARQGNCANGHRMTPENTRVDKRGWRLCVACEKARARRSAATRTRKSRAGV